MIRIIMNGAGNVAMRWIGAAAGAWMVAGSVAWAQEARPAVLWKGAAIPKAADAPVLPGVGFRVIKPYEFDRDGYRFLHGVALAWHKGKLYASFGHNKGGENTDTEEARVRASDDGGAP